MFTLRIFLNSLAAVPQVDAVLVSDKTPSCLSLARPWKSREDWLPREEGLQRRAWVVNVLPRTDDVFKCLLAYLRLAHVRVSGGWISRAIQTNDDPLSSSLGHGEWLGSVSLQCHMLYVQLRWVFGCRRRSINTGVFCYTATRHATKSDLDCPIAIIKRMSYERLACAVFSLPRKLLTHEL